MRRNQSTFTRLLLSLVVCMLLGAIVSAELPELMTLSDNTSNDFTGRKAGSRECIGMLDLAAHNPASLNALNLTCDAGSHFESLSENAGLIWSDPATLRPVLRR